METGSSHGPTPHEARETLRQLSEDAAAVRYPPLPRWFFTAQAVLVAGMYLAQLLPPSDARNATFAVAVAAIVLGGRYWLFRDQVFAVSPSVGDMLLFLTGLLGAFLACLVIEATTGAWWCWIVGAVVAVGIVLRTGHTYRKTYGDAA